MPPDSLVRTYFTSRHGHHAISFITQERGGTCVYTYVPLLGTWFGLREVFPWPYAHAGIITVRQIWETGHRLYSSPYVTFLDC